MHRASILIAMLWATLLLASGCSQDSIKEFKEAKARLAEDPTALDNIFHAQITLCRSVARASGKPIGAGTEFVMGEKTNVNALVDFRNCEIGKTYAVHLLWLKPGLDEMFRRYAEVRLEQAEGGYRAVIHWRESTNLTAYEEEIQQRDTPSFTLESRLNTSLDKQREPGEYVLRVYLHRELMLEQPFTLRA